MFTCIKCENSYNHTNGDVDERICYECLDEEDDRIVELWSICR